MKKWFLPGTSKAVIGLGITCTVGYGTLFYSFSLLSAAIEQSQGWSSSFIFGVFSFALIVGGAFAPIAGRWLDRYGARKPMAMGSLLVALGFLVLSQTTSQPAFIVAMVFLETVSVFVLYEAAFVALTQLAGQRARLPMTQITLMAGFASTLFWPLINYLLSWLDWRQVYMVLGMLHLFLCLPLHLWVLSHKEEGSDSIKSAISFTTPESSVSKSSSFWSGKGLLGLSLAVGAYGIAALQIHLFGLLAGLGITLSTATTIAVLIGPAQVVARLTDMWLGRHYSPLVLGIFSLLSMAAGIGCLFLSSLNTVFLVLFALLFGIGQGLTYIVRGALPLYLYGRVGYGALTGQLNSVRMVCTAIAPLSLVLVMESLGVYWALSALLVVLGAGVFALSGLQRIHSLNRSLS